MERREFGVVVPFELGVGVTGALGARRLGCWGIPVEEGDFGGLELLLHNEFPSDII